MRVVTSGVDSEYVLAGLSEYLRSLGHKVLEMDFGLEKDFSAHLSDFQSGNSVYITSSHINLTLKNSGLLSPGFAQLYPGYLSPLEIIPKINPVASIYVPHDLLTPFGDENLGELRFLDLFDYVLTPYPAQPLQATLGRSAQVIESGWIKYTDKITNSQSFEASDSKKLTLFATMIGHLLGSFGPKGVVEYFAPIVSAGFKIKLPVWRDIDLVEKLFNSNFPGCVIPAKESTASVILNSDVVVCNGASSIHAESVLMGVPTICLLDDEGMSTDEQRRKLMHLKRVAFHDYRRRAPIGDECITELLKLRSEPTIFPFDFSIVKNIIGQYSPR